MARKKFNPKRRIRPLPLDKDYLKGLSKKVQYGGNPVHKMHPGDFGLNPPSSPREDETLCGGTGILEKEKALALLQEGVRRGLISVKERNGFPQNVWAVTESGIAVEAQLENQSTGTYHGYPMTEGDLLAREVLRRWKP